MVKPIDVNEMVLRVGALLKRAAFPLNGNCLRQYGSGL